MAKPLNDKSEASAPKVNTVLLVALIVIIIALIFVIVYFFMNPRIQTVPETAPQRDVLITPENVSERIAELESHNDDSSYTTSMNIDWTFTDGASVSKNAYVENDVSNSRPVYFDVILSSSGETVYSSPIIPIGSTLRNIRLNKELSKGDHRAVVVYHLIDENNRDVSTISVAITLHILN